MKFIGYLLLLVSFSCHAGTATIDSWACLNKQDNDDRIFYSYSAYECSQVRGRGDSLCLDFQKNALAIANTKCIPINGTYQVLQSSTAGRQNNLKTVQIAINGKKYWALAQ